ncbi:hypothetical protein F4553_005253 [Allocatelliglobosispora scoriae]|uniref:Choice-of-anchor D domain-containing protein n=1 Tax=Allocatelliglobosispora scoriae TaxID=643052 RepID=A0A841BUJ1_9ACTN|nr:choice-of-anchor D domain-containing protein [Allocatelliglobosispora scoriae]MBB5871874.1 hypothetical protein [Allocatelliglobosispora scoriae]
MRTIRGALVGALLLMSVVTIPATAAQAAAPTAPYTAFTYLGDQAYPWKGALAFDGAAVNVTHHATSDAIAFSATWSDHSIVIDLYPKDATQWVAGTTYPLNGNGASASVGADSRGCSNHQGSITVLDVAHDATTHEMTSFAASYAIGCGTATPNMFGQVRWNSGLDYKAYGNDVSSLDFGWQGAGYDTAVKTVTITGRGTQGVKLSAASIGAANWGAYGTSSPGTFAITSDTCSNATLAYGATCTVGVKAHPTVRGPLAAALNFTSDANAGRLSVDLAVSGTDPRSASYPTSLSFGSVQVGKGLAKTVTVTGTGPSPISISTVQVTGGQAADFTITANTCNGATLAKNQSCTITVNAHPNRVGQRWGSLYINNNSDVSIFSVEMSLVGTGDAVGTYYPVSPTRILDTRNGTGAPKAQVGPGQVIHLQVGGHGNVPSSGVSAVVLNVTATAPTGTTYITAYPTGVTRPTASSLNVTRGVTVASSVTVALGTDGQIDLYNYTNSTHLLADVVGYYGKDNSLLDNYNIGGQLQGVVPERLLDTRYDLGAKLPAGYYVNVPVSYGASVNPHIKALAVNVTAVDPSGDGHLRTWNGNPYELPNASTVNYSRGKVVPNFAIVPVAPCDGCGSASGLPSIGIYTSAKTHVIVDIVGFFDDSTLADGLRFNPITPTRIVDSRESLGLAAPIGPAQTAKVTVPDTIATANTEGLALNVTAVAPTATTYLTVWPADAGLSKPTVSNLNPSAGQVIPNAVVTGIGSTKAFNIYNYVGYTNVVVDVVGTFYAYGGSAPAAQGAAGTAGKNPASIVRRYAPVMHNLR